MMRNGSVATRRVVVVGCSGHARVVIDILESENSCKLIGLLDTYKPAGTRLLGYEILGSEAELPHLIQEDICDCVVVAVGDNWTRAQIVKHIRELVAGVCFVSTIHPSAQIARSVVIGDGTVIMPGVVVNAGARIGECCILNTSSSLDHDSTMEDFSSLAPRAVTGGNVSIGAFSAVAIGAVVSHGVNIGRHTVIGGGAMVTRDVPSNVVAYGVPAKVIRQRKPADSYLGERSYEAPANHAPVQCSATDLSMKLTALPSDSPEWNAYLGRTSHDIFHTAEYHRVTEAFGGGKACLFVYGNENKFLAWPIIIRELEGFRVSTPTDITSAYGYTGPTVCECADDQEFLRAAWNRIREYWQSQGLVSAFTRFHPLLGNHCYVPYLRDEHARPFQHDAYGEGATIAIDLSRSADETWRTYGRQHRQAVRRLSKRGMKVTWDSEWAHLADFVRIYHSTMERNLASDFYFFSEDYFRSLREVLSPHASLMIASLGNDIAAAALLTEYGGIVNVHLLATDDRFLTISPSKLLIHKAQEWARERGNKFLHLGGGRGRRIDDPLFVFKSKFSDKSYPFYTGRWVLNRELYDALTFEGLQEKGLQENRTAMSTDTAESFFPAYRVRV